MRRLLLTAIVAVLVGTPPAEAQGPSDPLLWRDYLSPSDWKEYKGAVEQFIEASAITAKQKAVCKMPLGTDTEEHFLDLLTGMNLLRNGVETVVPKEKWRAWQHLLGAGGGPKCDAKEVPGYIKIKQRWHTELLNLQARGFKNMMDGGRKYR